jgi:hypothetical protein
VKQRRSYVHNRGEQILHQRSTLQPFWMWDLPDHHTSVSNPSSAVHLVFTHTTARGQHSSRRPAAIYFRASKECHTDYGGPRRPIGGIWSRSCTYGVSSLNVPIDREYGKAAMCRVLDVFLRYPCFTAAIRSHHSVQAMSCCNWLAWMRA